MEDKTIITKIDDDLTIFKRPIEWKHKDKHLRIKRIFLSKPRKCIECNKELKDDDVCFWCERLKEFYHEDCHHSQCLNKIVGDRSHFDIFGIFKTKQLTLKSGETND